MGTYAWIPRQLYHSVPLILGIEEPSFHWSLTCQKENLPFPLLLPHSLFALPFARLLLHMLLWCLLCLFPHDLVLPPFSSLLILSNRKELGAIFFTTYVTTQNIHFPLGSGMFMSLSRPSALAYPISPSPPHPLNLILSV